MLGACSWPRLYWRANLSLTSRTTIGHGPSLVGSAAGTLESVRGSLGTSWGGDFGSALAVRPRNDAALATLFLGSADYATYYREDRCPLNYDSTLLLFCTGAPVLMYYLIVDITLSSFCIVQLLHIHRIFILTYMRLRFVSWLSCMPFIPLPVIEYIVYSDSNTRDG